MADEPDIIQRLSADFNVINDLSIDFNASPQPVQVQVNQTSPIETELNTNQQIETSFTTNIVPISVDFGTVYVVSGDCKVLYATTATWNSQPELVSARGYVYIYCDYRQDGQGRNIASIKVGDGLAYLIDLPFTDELLYDHIYDQVRHITQEEREFWNNKVSCFLSGEDNLVFTTE